MIKYPVYVMPFTAQKDKCWNIVSDNHVDICTIYDKNIANTIANALNALHEAPVPSLSLTIYWRFGKLCGKYVEWYNKFIKKGV
jgi:hypothetical protein